MLTKTVIAGDHNCIHHAESAPITYYNMAFKRKISC